MASDLKMSGGLQAWHWHLPPLFKASHEYLWEKTHSFLCIKMLFGNFCILWTSTYSVDMPLVIRRSKFWNEKIVWGYFTRYLVDTVSLYPFLSQSECLKEIGTVLFCVCTVHVSYWHLINLCWFQRIVVTHYSFCWCAAHRTWRSHGPFEELLVKIRGFVFGVTFGTPFALWELQFIMCSITSSLFIHLKNDLIL